MASGETGFQQEVVHVVAEAKKVWIKAMTILLGSSGNLRV